jgi:hypothetical protein
MPVSITATLMPSPVKPSSLWATSAPVIVIAVANWGPDTEVDGMGRYRECKRSDQ